MIETKRTVLRPLERKDLIMRARWLSNPAVRETLVLMFPVSIAETELWFERILVSNTRKDFIIELKEAEKPIGFAGYINIDWINRKAEPFIAIGEENVWGKGYGTEVVRALLDFGFNEMGLNRMYGFMLDFNQRALKMDLKAGFKKEGLLKEDVLIHGEFHDRIMLGITKNEFNRAKINKNESF